MLRNIEIDYKKYLNGKLDFQKKIGKIKFSNLIIISGITCVGKSTFIEKNKLPSLMTYKTGNNIKPHKKQIIINQKKFHKKMINGVFFDIYSINGNYYGYSIEDYYILSRKYGNVFIEVSIESIYLGLRYIPKKIFILDYSEEQINKNIVKRIQERKYSKKRINLLKKTIEKEKRFLEKIKEGSDLICLKIPLESRQQMNFINSNTNE
ncbi:MAG TPA: hypothetical protein PK674_01220 [Candidatus Absconditabacterales bacterium]|nr:hypothetical protein [Candidatus Absconditabacterales bacterium]HOQ78771.1 hypothetical protein [Candidatus Absconditabacterales bacterium]HPK27882.1 hypothetical protein [Candidatus Absconditabacterales bacterium]